MTQEPLTKTFEMLERLRNTSLASEKIKILQETRCPETEKILKLVYTNNTYGLTSRSLGDVDEKLHPHAESKWWPAVQVTLKALASRKLMGIAAKQVLWRHLHHAPSQKHASFLRDLLDRDLRVGVNIPTINTAIPGFISVFKCQQSKLFDLRFVEFPVYVQSKLKGIRALAIDGKLYSKHGVLLNLPTIEKHLPQDVVLDGSLCTGSQEESGITRFFVFDVIPKNEWDIQEFKLTLTERLKEQKPAELRGAHEFITWIPPILVTSFDILWEMYSISLERGDPGVMVKKADAPYILGRSRDWMRLIPLETMEVKAIGIQVEPEGKGREVIVGIICECENSETFELTVGMEINERREWGEHGLPSKRLVVRYQELDYEGRPKFPRFEEWIREGV